VNTLFLAWRDPLNRGWYTVGRLRHAGQFFEFVYTRGMLHAHKEAGFRALPSFPEPEYRYLSTELFPLFSNRLPNQSRPDYHDFVQYLNVPESPHDPIAMLGLSGGRRVTDNFEVFPQPVRDATGVFHIRFFVHGLSHFPPASNARADHLQAGERLLLQHDFQNPFDARALMLRTAEQTPGDLYPIGFCPRYLLDDLMKVVRTGSPVVTVEKVNPTPAPAWFRVLCGLSAIWPANYEPFAGEQYQPLSESLPPRYVASATLSHMPPLSGTG
jgi:hypothetical protein